MARLVLEYFACLLSFALSLDQQQDVHPNVILIVMDDWGFNDVAWHDHTDTSMPFLKQFVEEKALRVDTFYSLPLCSMTRSALLTGRYPMRYGLQSSVVENAYPFGLSVFETIIAGEFQQQGYRTYAIGKWHLGFHRADLTPLQRGFDEFRGSLSPMLHYFNYEYTVNRDEVDYTGRDLWINHEPVAVSDRDTDRQYLTDWEADQFIDVLDSATDQESDAPFFMYVAMHASHDPREATQECLDLYQETQCMNRELEDWMDCEQHQIMQAQTSCADLALQRMLEHLQGLQDGKVWEQTLLIWLSDNGAPVWEGDNSPLRGAKKEIYEGGVRTPMFVSGGYLNADRYGQMFDASTPFHVVDIYPTILAAANLHQLGHKPLDGQNQWQAIQSDSISSEIDGSRREFLYNVDPEYCETIMCGAYRYGPWKFVWSQNTDTPTMYWYDAYSTHPRRNEDGSLNEAQSDYLGCGPIPHAVQSENEYDENGEIVGGFPCGDKPCLFNVEHDPCEYRDVAHDPKYANLYLYMYNMLMAYYESQQISLRAYYEDKFDTNGNPKLRETHNGYWQPWIRSYDAHDDYVDFEDVMRKHYTYDRSQDVRLSVFYDIAQQYKQLWEQEEQAVLVSDASTGTGAGEKVDIDRVESAETVAEEETRLETVHFSVLMFVAVMIALVVLVGCVFVTCKWIGVCHLICQYFANRRRQSAAQKQEDDDAMCDVAEAALLLQHENTPFLN